MASKASVSPIASKSIVSAANEVNVIPVKPAPEPLKAVAATVPTTCKVEAGLTVPIPTL